MQVKIGYSSNRKLIDRFSRIYAMKYRLDGARSHVAVGALIALSVVAVLLAARGVPTGLGVWIDFGAAIAANLLGLAIFVPIVSFLFTLIRLPIPRKVCAAAIFLFLEVYFILSYAELGRPISIVFAFIYCSFGICSGYFLGWLYYARLKSVSKIIMAALGTIIMTALLTVLAINGPSAVPERDKHFTDSWVANDNAAAVLETDNPAEPGQYAYHKYTYGSGKDKHRKWFGSQVDLISDPVDASSYITHWSWLKKAFWGFDAAGLPVNGTVWMPEGKGPFPLALIVHGNHLMEYFSDEGYEYLGELLASRGIIAVSVDENFLNYSAWSSIPDNDMLMRAWVLLQHINQLKKWNSSATIFENQIDMHNLAIIGHSRGGQAAAMAADRDRFFDDAAALPDKEEYTVKAVVALAPTDTAIQDQYAELKDTYYLTLQGARDADVNNFFGERQYARVSLSGENRFKAALYIADANHSQFNSKWGTMDESLPGGLFLNRNGMLSKQEQQNIAKLYVSAFLEAALNDKFEFKQLFQDYRSVTDWLPDTQYISRYEESSFVPIAPGPIVSEQNAVGMTGWNEAYAKNRDGQSKDVKGIELEWEEAGAQYDLLLSDMASDELGGLGEANFVFSLANMEHELIEAAGSETPEQSNEQQGANASQQANSDSAEAEGNRLEPSVSFIPADAEQERAEQLPPTPVVEIELETDSGEILVLELNDHMPVAAPMYASFTSLSWLEQRIKNEKYKQPAETVFQTFVVPMDLFTFIDSDKNKTAKVDPTAIQRITFRFQSGPGKIMLSDIGFMS